MTDSEVIKVRPGDQILVRLFNPSGVSIGAKTTTPDRRGEPFEIGCGQSDIFPFVSMGLANWLLPERHSVSAGNRLVVATTTKGDIHTWCPAPEMDTLQLAIRKDGPWSFCDPNGNPSTGMRWVAFLRHLILRRRLQQADAVNTVRERLNEARLIIRASDPALKKTGVPHTNLAQGLIDWVIGHNKDIPGSVASAWQA